jgi:beta-galactosidase
MNKISRRCFHLLGAGAALGPTRIVRDLFASLVPAAADANGRTIFPFGTHVYREPHLPLEQFRHDFPLLKKLGFTMIKIQEVWAYDEPRQGEIDLSNVSQVVADARQNGLRVYFGITMENAPGWFWKEFPDATMVYETGQPHNDPTQYVLPGDGKPGPCWHHLPARQAAIRFIEAVGREIGKYDNIEVWNVFQEIGLWPMRPGHLGLCYCHNTLPAFRAWLRTRYASLKELNENWRCAYGDWDEIDPPRTNPKVPPTIDWRYFMDDVYLSEVLRWKGDAFRRSDPLHRPILAHVGGITVGGTREWRYAEQLDVLGSSCYPGWSNPGPWDATHGSPEKPLTEVGQVNHEVAEILMHFDYLRSAKPDRHIWTAELQGGPITEGLNRRRVPSAADIRRWVLSCLAAGARGICFWNHRPEIFWEEGYGFSLLDWQSDSSERAEEAGRLARAVTDHVDLFARGEHPEPAVAVVVSEDLFHFAEGSLHNFLEHFQYSVTGNWKSLWSEGFSAGFVDINALPATPDKVKALVLPFPLTLNQSMVENLSSYVRHGGVVISEACPGRFSNHGMAFKGNMAAGIAELFGATETGVFLIREPGPSAKWTISEYGPRDVKEFRKLSGVGECSKESVFPAFYLQTLTPQTAKPILMYGDRVAGCVNTFGKGQAYLVGTLLGHALPAYNDSRNARFLAAVLTRASVRPDNVGELKRRRRVLGNQSAWFLFNLTERPIEAELPLENFRSVKDLLGPALPSNGNTVHVRVEPLDVRCLVLNA